MGCHLRKSDAERPSLYALQRASQALVPPGATFEYVAWECFISSAEEGKLQRAGKMPKVTQELVLSGGDKLAVKDSRVGDAPGQKVSDTDLFRKYMDMRARTFSMIGAGKVQHLPQPYGQVSRLHQHGCCPGYAGAHFERGEEVRQSLTHRDSQVVSQVDGEP